MATIRGSIECLTCAQPHTLRIAMGQEVTHEHKFECRKCNEPIVVHLDVNYVQISAIIRCGENSKLIDEVVGAPIVNLDANFLIGDHEQGQDMVFPRMRQISKLFKEAEASGRLGAIPTPSSIELQSRPYRRPDYLAEWQLLRKAWSLARNGKEKLSNRIIESASREFYSSDPLSDLADWVWRMSLYMCQPHYEQKMRDAVECLNHINNDDQLLALAKHYNSEMRENRAKIYFDAIREFFSGYPEFSQVFFQVASGKAILAEQKATSLDFDRIKMTYGNLFEAFTSLVELPVLMNNILLGRTYDQFEKLTLDGYRRLDKSSRIGPLSMTAPLMGLCEEADNQLRNASHHGGIQLDSASQTLSYRAGKGGQGDEQSMAYTQYLSCCVRLFLQILTLLRVELLFCQKGRMRSPI